MFSGLLRRFQGSSVIRPRPLGRHECDLLIPVFGRPDMLRNLLASLEGTVDRSLLGRIWIGNDGSDAFTTDTINRLASSSTLPITVVHHEKNLGFGENCNTLFQRSDAQLCVILNTDIRVPPHWLERLLAPFALDARIALATPLSTNAANHTVRLRSGQHWMDADTLLATIPSTFPDDCTAIGFCMAVHAGHLKEKSIPLFDTAFVRGYGEDTDLHYRIVTSGLRSVIVDNLLVHHEGGASFSSLSDHADIRSTSVDTFRARWGRVHDRAHAVFEWKNALRTVRDRSTLMFTHRSPPYHLDILFVIPTSNMRYGGIRFIFEVAQALRIAGFRLAIVDLEHVHHAEAARYGFAVFKDADDVRTHVSSVACVVSTAENTLATAETFVRHYGAMEWMFLQSMEVVFRTGRNVETFLQYARAPNVLTVSDCLSRYITLIHPSAHVRHARLGPDPLVFYPRDVVRTPRTVAVAANLFPEKGTTRSLEIALMLWQRGFRITLFGWDADKFRMDPAVGDVMRDTSHEALAYLFSETEFIIDQSSVEGLGLLPLEAAFCGCIPLIGSRGAAEYLFTDGVNSITVNGYKDLEASLSRVQSLRAEDLARLRHGAMSLRDECNLTMGLDDAVTIFSEILGRRGKC